MLNLECFILDPLTNRVVAKLDAMGCFRCHVVRPFDTSFIDIVEDGRSVGVGNIVPSFGHAASEIAKVDHLFRGGACSSNFSLAGAKGSTFLALAKPTKRPSIFKNNPSVHAAKLE